MTQDSLKGFFLSWGLDAEDEWSSVSGPVYSKMVEEAEKKNLLLARFIGRAINATDGDFYLKDCRWSDLWNSWKQFSNGVARA